MIGDSQPCFSFGWSFAALLAFAGFARGADADMADLAARIRATSGFTGGLIVHLDCNDGRLTAALKQNAADVVHGLDDSADDIARARETIQSAGCYGPVSVEPFNGPHLLYADNMVNLLVAGPCVEVSREEILRVLCPGGQAVFLPAEPSQGADGKQPALSRLTKPWPKALDQWTHFLHDPSNNAVAHDSEVGPPDRLQWTAEPLWSKEHDVTPSLFALVSGGGRLFYILNEGPVCTIDEKLPDRYSVVARDAFNGVLLWKRPMSDWYSSRIIWGHIPVDAQRRLVAAGDRIYVTLSLQGPVVALDAASGAILHEYAGTERTSEIVCSGGRLALVTRKTHVLDGLLAGRDGNRFRRGYPGHQDGGDELLVVREDTGECLWRSQRRAMPLTLAVAGDRVLFAEDQNVACLDLDTGKELWAAPCSAARTLVVHDKTVFAANADPAKVTLTAFDLMTGARLWSREAGSLPNFLFFFAPLDVFVARALVWGMAEGLEWNKEPGSGHLLGLDLRTGEVRRRIRLAGAFTTDHHVRCYKGKATENYLLFNKRGIEFIGLDPDQPATPNRFQWVRGTCRYGILPSNGLIYAPPHACVCYPGAKVDGFLALAPVSESRTESQESTEEERLKRGPAYPAGSQPQPSQSGPEQTTLDASSSWPTYRGDNCRSGHTPTSVPADLAVAWEVKPGVKLSSPVVAEGKVLAAAVDQYTVHAWDAKQGKSLWSYTAGGRIDSPPTVHDGTAIFGCHDGWVYCVRLDDGRLVWRFRAAPAERRVGGFGRLESPWPVHGSVLVKDGTAYFAAGKSSFLDGGIAIYGVDAATGERRYENRLSGPDPQTPTSQVTAGRMPGAVPDILSGDETGLYMRHVKLDWQLSTPPPEQFDWAVKGEGHLLAGSGFLDDTLFNRTIWQYGIRIDRSQMLVIDGGDVYGLRVYEGISWNCPVHHVGDGHLIFRQDVSKPVPRPSPQESRRLGRIPTERYAWQTRIPLRVSAMLLSGEPAERLFVAGVPDAVAPDDPLAFIEGRRGAKLLALDAATGKQTAELSLDAPPVWDGLAAAHGRIYLTTADGKLICLAGR